MSEADRWSRLQSQARIVEVQEQALRDAQEEFAKRLQDAVDAYGQKPIAEHVGISSPFIMDVRLGRRAPTQRLTSGIWMSKVPKFAGGKG